MATILLGLFSHRDISHRGYVRHIPRFFPVLLVLSCIFGATATHAMLEQLKDKSYTGISACHGSSAQLRAFFSLAQILVCTFLFMHVPVNMRGTSGEETTKAMLNRVVLSAREVYSSHLHP